MVTRKKPVEQLPTLAQDVELLAGLKEKDKLLAQEIKDAQQRIISAMSEADLKTTSVHAGTGKNERLIRATLVRGEATKINGEALKKQLSVSQWNKVTQRVLDNKKLEEAIANGVVDPLKVADCTATIERAPYVRLTA